jgi:c-di-GMP-binding flagellar brake protein YcgR
MTIPNGPPRAGTAAAAESDSERFQVHDRLEILGLMRALVERRALVTVVYSGGSLFFVSAVLAVLAERDELIVDRGPDDETNKRVLASARLTLATLLDNIRVQFHAYSVAETLFEGRPALRLPLPEAVMRLQRREYYRLRVPRATGSCCELRPNPADPGAAARLPLYDISCGGLALVDWPDGGAPETHRIYRDCRLQLSPGEVISTDLEVVYVLDRTDADGTRVRRCGARFVDMPGMVMTRIQRYITRIERELNAQRDAEQEVRNRTP